MGREGRRVERETHDQPMIHMHMHMCMCMHMHMFMHIHMHMLMCTCMCITLTTCFVIPSCVMGRKKEAARLCTVCAAVGLVGLSGCQRCCQAAVCCRAVGQLSGCHVKA